MQPIKARGWQEAIQTKMIAQYLFPLHEWIKGHHTTYWLKLFQQTQFFERPRLQAWQAQQLGPLFTHTYQHHAFYRKFWGRHPRWLADVPLMDKKCLQANAVALQPLPQLNLRAGYTSGSSGTPLFYYQSRHRIARDVAAKWRCLRWLDLDIGAREAVVWGSPLEWARYTSIHRLRDRLLNTRLFPVAHLDPYSMQQLLAELNQYQPRLLVGYPSVLEQLLKMADNPVMRKRLQPQAVLTTAEELLPHTKEFLECTLQCPVINSYGAREAGFIAQTCSQGNLHVMAENIVLEIIDPKTERVLPADQLGEIVITNLSSYDYPIVRYRTGDLGVLTEEPCTCGIRLPILKQLEGRNTDFLLNQQRQKIHRAQLSAIFSLFPMIQQFKIIQHTLNHIEVICSPNHCTMLCVSQLTEKMQSCFGDAAIINIHLSDSLVTDAARKHRFVENRMPLCEQV